MLQEGQTDWRRVCEGSLHYLSYGCAQMCKPGRYDGCRGRDNINAMMPHDWAGAVCSSSRVQDAVRNEREVGHAGHGPCTLPTLGASDVWASWWSRRDSIATQLPSNYNLLRACSSGHAAAANTFDGLVEQVVCLYSCGDTGRRCQILQCLRALPVHRIKPGGVSLSTMGGSCTAVLLNQDCGISGSR